MSERNIVQPDNATSSEQSLDQLRSLAIAARRELEDWQENEVKRVIGEAALKQSRVARHEEEYREAVEALYLGEEREGRKLLVSGEVRAIVKKDGFWISEPCEVDNLEVLSIRVQHPRFIREIDDLDEHELDEATIVAYRENGENYYIPESSVVEFKS